MLSTNHCDMHFIAMYWQLLIPPHYTHTYIIGQAGITHSWQPLEVPAVTNPPPILHTPASLAMQVVSPTAGSPLKYWQSTSFASLPLHPTLVRRKGAEPLVPGPGLDTTPSDASLAVNACAAVHGRPS